MNSAPAPYFDAKTHINNGWYEPHETPEHEAWEQAWNSFDPCAWAADNLDEVADALDNDHANQWRLLRLVEAFYHERRNCLLLARFNEACADLKEWQLLEALMDCTVPTLPLIEVCMDMPPGMTDGQKAACECLRDWVDSKAKALFELSQEQEQ